MVSIRFRIIPAEKYSAVEKWLYTKIVERNNVWLFAVGNFYFDRYGRRKFWKFPNFISQLFGYEPNTVNILIITPQENFDYYFLCILSYY